MSIKKVGPNRWDIRVRQRVAGSSQFERRKVISGTLTNAKQLEADLYQEMVRFGGRRSLKIETFREALEYYREHTNANLKTVDTLISRLISDIGNVSIENLAQGFGEYLTLLKSERSKTSGRVLTVTTRNKLLCYAKTAVNLCMKRGLIDRNPLTGFTKQPEEPRDRVLTEDEEIRLLATLKDNDSYLYWPVRFSLKNPIRKGDLIALTRNNLDRFKPCIHFRASKTWKRKMRETVLINLDYMLDYFDLLPPGCDYLFPRTIEGTPSPLGNFQNHWKTMLRRARIDDFTWHDLKHCAITYMMDAGFNEHDLRGLGIQYSPAMIARYYHHDVDKVLKKKRLLDALPEQLQETAT